MSEMDNYYIKERIDLYMLAANQGDAQVQCGLGFCCMNGIGVTKDKKKAIKFYTLAANPGDTLALYSLGTCYEYGIGVAKDEKKALELYYQLQTKDWI